MREPTATIYINPTMYQGEQGTSNIAHIPVNTPINPDMPPTIVNEYGQTIINPDIPVPLNEPLTPIQQAQQTAQDIKDAVLNAIIPSDNPKPKNFGTIIADKKAITLAKTTTPKPTTNYLLYGAIGVGALVILTGIFKK